MPFATHAVVVCSPNCASAGDYSETSPSRIVFVHPSWKRSAVHRNDGEDRHCFSAQAEGSARVDLITDGSSLRIGPNQTVFKARGPAIVIYALP